MSLDDRIQVNIGDLVKFESERVTIVGYVRGYSDATVKLSNCSPFPKRGGQCSFLEKHWLQKRYTINLTDFDKYEVVKKFVPSACPL